MEISSLSKATDYDREQLADQEKRYLFSAST
jgi:hypothetical protein